jgi:hypothetical protein
MPPAVIARVNLLGNVEPSILTFTNWHGWEIGDNTQNFKLSGDDDSSVVKHLTDEFPGVLPAPEDDAVLPGVDMDFDAEPTATGVEVDSNYAPQDSAEVNGLRQQDTNAAPTEEPSCEPNAASTVETQAPSPKKGMVVHNARNRKQPEKYFPSMSGNKYAVVLTQIAASLKGSKHGMSMAQMLVKLMPNGAHRRADVVGMIMAQLSMKAAIKNGAWKLSTP